MSLKRTNVYADSEDLAVIKDAAARRGVSEAEIIRDAIHRAAQKLRVWAEPLDFPSLDGPGTPIDKADVTRAVVDGVQRR
ncbi:CopG family transcriptional regulator [Nocardia amikacinitolerans]|uniref:ribbon-helix-helix domain-containing protein n=1 Tax=Nocardia amikacinitolerans TaxID=756689 RepID=UPI0020A3F114|nr:CopG family transcriptional regulator [Nocardia amikacinitolerans]